MESGKVKGNKTEAGVSRGLRLFKQRQVAKRRQMACRIREKCKKLNRIDKMAIVWYSLYSY